ncbi:hypothetical protein [Larkinella terrae]|uniref:Tetratricopeptide repeat protein n=1 Tax=Larkinella terrae TaxID=2025311 RepID=A0A7K0ELF4_9BACT|nr:hypothetical protein [Larkinella terrae]MRS62614.1 hypothetical protein [Larkinella terrae]
MNELERIEDYFSGRLPAEERARFETSLQTDSALAEAVAFYLAAQQAAQSEARNRRKAEFEKLRTETPVIRRLSALPAFALAASILLILGLGSYWLFQRQSPSAILLAEQYIQENYSHVSITMDGRSDSLQTGISFYNAGKFREAGAVFNELVRHQPDNDRARQFAGLVALRTNQYAAAIDHFHRLSEQRDLFANPGLFLEALARLKRNQTDDKARAEILLKIVVNQNLEGKAQAEKLLEAF